MADRLTQLQDCLDQLATQIYASLRYITTHHDYAPIPNQPDMNPYHDHHHNTGAATADEYTGPTGPTTNNDQNQNNTNETNPDNHPVPDANQDPNPNPHPDPDQNPNRPPPSPSTFTASLHELAHDLVVKERQIEILARSLPGIGASEQMQLERMRVLVDELAGVEAERRTAEAERDEVLEKVEMVLGRVRGV